MPGQLPAGRVLSSRREPEPPMGRAAAPR